MFYPYSKTFYSTSFCFLYTILSSKTLALSLMTNQTCISLSSFHFPCQSSASLSTKVAKCVRLSHSHCQDPGGLHLVIQLFLLRISLSPFYQWSSFFCLKFTPSHKHPTLYRGYKHTKLNITQLSKEGFSTLGAKEHHLENPRAQLTYQKK